jgi:hypothetical protein
MRTKEGVILEGDEKSVLEGGKQSAFVEIPSTMTEG